MSKDRLARNDGSADAGRPAATVVIPFQQVNRQLFLAVRSVFAQTFTDWELLLLADGPPPPGIQHLEDLAHDPRVTVASDGLHLGLAARLNQAALLAQAPLLFRMDADDVMHPERLQRQVAHLDANPECDLLGTRAYLLSEADDVLGLFREAALPTSVYDVLRSVPFTHPTVAGRTKWFRENPYDPSFIRGQDKELWARTFAAANRQKLDLPLLYYRIAKRPSRENYRLTKASDRRVARRYGRGWHRGPAILLVLGAYLKQWIFSLLSLCDATHVIRARQATSIGTRETAQAAATIAQIDAIRLPSRKPDRQLTVTVGISTFNAGDVILGAVSSVIAQSYQDWHLLIVDDGSTDDTLAKLGEVTDPRVSVLTAEQRNVGLAARLNQIARAAEGDLLFRMDADDLMHPQRIERQVAYMADHPGVDVLGCRAYTIDEFNRVRGLFQEAQIGDRPQDWLRACGLSHPTVCMRTSWAHANPYDPSLRRSEDLDLWARTGSAVNFGKLEEALLFYRVPRRVNLPSYRQSKVADRIIIRHLARSEGFDRLPKTWLLTKSVLKECVMVFAVAIGWDSRLQARKASNLEMAELLDAQRELRLALSQSGSSESQ